MIDWISNNYQSIIICVIGGMTTALGFLLLLRPKLWICKKIAELEDDNGKKYYKFKFYNRSLFPAIDVKATLMFGKSTEEGEVNVNVIYEPLDLTREESFYLDGWKLTTKKTKHAPHCVTIRCMDQDFDKLLKEYGSLLEFRVSLKHGFSNLSRTKSRTFNRKECITKGDFSFGNSTKIS